MDTLNGSGGWDAPKMCLQKQFLKIQKKFLLKNKVYFFSDLKCYTLNL